MKKIWNLGIFSFLLLVTITGCGLVGQSECEDAPFLGHWNNSSGDDLVLSSSCSGSYSRCNMVFNFSGTFDPDATEGEVELSISQSSGTSDCPPSDPVDLELCDFRLTNGGQDLNLECTNGITSNNDFEK